MLEIILTNSQCPQFWSTHISKRVSKLPKRVRWEDASDIWQGAGNPKINTFKPLVHDAINLLNTGIDIMIDREILTVRAIVLLFTMDLQARFYVLKFTAHNNKYKCTYCINPCGSVPSGKGHTRSYIFNEQILRTAQHSSMDAREAESWATS